MIVAVDFDNTIMNPMDKPEGKSMGNPMPGAKEALKDMRKHGHKIIIHTVRGGNPQHVRDWLKYYGIPFDDVTNIKPNDVAFFIDDHGLRFNGDWNITLKTMYELHGKYLEDKQFRSMFEGKQAFKG